MSSTNDTATEPGIKLPTGEKIAAWLIIAIVTYLFIAQ